METVPEEAQLATKAIAGGSCKLLFVSLLSSFSFHSSIDLDPE